jgi:hypothetical protein
MQTIIRNILALGLVLSFTAAIADELPEVLVYKSPTCTCCAKWATHLEENGFSVTTSDESNMNKIKKELGVPLNKASCHTAVVGDYIIEGHVPAEDVIKLIESGADVKGLTVPGMPLGSPGMEAPQPQRYTVYTFDAEGNTKPFAEHGPRIDD